jgi:hypothetical protein
LKALFFCFETVIRHLECKFCQALPVQISIPHETAQQIKAPGDDAGISDKAWVDLRSNFKNKHCLSRETQS